MAATKKQAKNPFLSLLAEVQKRLDPKLIGVLEESERRAFGYGPEVGYMVSAVRSLCERGGKRLRPGLCLVGSLSMDEDADWEPALEAGVSLELLQAYFLIHDDWMDKDDERRGGPTAHVQLARRFRSKELGACGAILAGDHAVALASAHLATLPVSASRLKRCAMQFAEMQIAAVAGQQLDVIGKTKNPELTYELKTASYTVRGPLLLGAEIAGASRSAMKTLDQFSLPTGIAFQLRDDLIGVFGTSDVTGKPQGGDLKEGKNTSLVREGKRRLKGKDKERVDAVLGNRRATDRQVQAAISALENCGAKQAVEGRILDLKTEAQETVAGSSLSLACKNLLQGAVVALADRRA